MPPSDADKLDDYRFQMGHDAGNLALALDQLTDAITALNQHLVYYRLEAGQRAAAPPDLAPLLAVLAGAKGLVQETLLRLRDEDSGNRGEGTSASGVNPLNHPGPATAGA